MKEYKCFDNEHVDYEPVKEAGGEIFEKEKRWPTHEEIQAEFPCKALKSS